MRAERVDVGVIGRTQGSLVSAWLDLPVKRPVVLVLVVLIVAAPAWLLADCPVVESRRSRGRQLQDASKRTGRSTDGQDRHDLVLQAAGDVHLARGVDEHVDLAAHAELVEVDPRLDREAGPAQHQALVVRLEVVHVGAVAVDFLADVVAGAVDEVCGRSRRRRSPGGRRRRLPSRGAGRPAA